MKFRSREGWERRLQVGYKNINNKCLLQKTKFKQHKIPSPRDKRLYTFWWISFQKPLFVYVHIKVSLEDALQGHT